MRISRIEEKNKTVILVFDLSLNEQDLKKHALCIIRSLNNKQVEYSIKTKGNFSIVIHIDNGDETERLKLLLETIKSENKLDF